MVTLRCPKCGQETAFQSEPARPVFCGQCAGTMLARPDAPTTDDVDEPGAARAGEPPRAEKSTSPVRPEHDSPQDAPRPAQAGRRPEGLEPL